MARLYFTRYFLVGYNLSVMNHSVSSLKAPPCYLLKLAGVASCAIPSFVRCSHPKRKRVLFALYGQVAFLRIQRGRESVQWICGREFHIRCDCGNHIDVVNGVVTHPHEHDAHLL